MINNNRNKNFEPLERVDPTGVLIRAYTFFNQCYDLQFGTLGPIVMTVVIFFLTHIYLATTTLTNKYLHIYYMCLIKIIKTFEVKNMYIRLHGFEYELSFLEEHNILTTLTFFII